MICKNCGQKFEGNYCNNCGQNSSVGKIDLKYFLNEISDSIFQVNRGFPFTVKELFTRPGHSIRQFIEGKRKQHFKPIAFVLLASTLYVLLTYLVGKNTVFGEFISGMTASLRSDNAESSTSIRFFNWLVNNQTYATLILLPFFSLASYLAFIKLRYNYFEHLVLNLFITGQQMVIYLIFSFVLLVDNYYLEAIPTILGIIFTFWTFNQFFEDRKFSIKVLMTVMTYIYFIIIMMIIGFIVALFAMKK